MPYTDSITHSFSGRLFLLLMQIQGDPNGSLEKISKFTPLHAGVGGGGVVVCGAENEVAPDEEEDDYWDIRERKLESGRINYEDQKSTVFAVSQ